MTSVQISAIKHYLASASVDVLRDIATTLEHCNCVPTGGALVHLHTVMYPDRLAIANELKRMQVVSTLAKRLMQERQHWLARIVAALDNPEDKRIHCALHNSRAYLVDAILNINKLVAIYT